MATLGIRGNQACGCNVDEDAVPENSMPSLEDHGDKTPAIPKQENPGVGGPTFNKLHAARDGSGALEDVGMETSSEGAETHSCAEGIEVILNGLTAMQYYGQVGKILKICTTASTQDRIPVALVNGHGLGVKITNREIAPTENHAGRTQYAGTADCEHHRDHQENRETHVPGENQAGDQWRGGGGPPGRHAIGGR